MINNSNKKMFFIEKLNPLELKFYFLNGINYLFEYIRSKK
jgi:hypothetical protein